MYRIVIFFVFSTALLTVTARGNQSCTPADLAQKPGLLRASRLSGSTGGLPAADVARARATLTKIHQSIATGYKPVGLVGEYSYHFNGGTTAGVFGYSLYLLKYNCDSSSSDPAKFYIGTDTPTVVRIDANVINSLYLSAADTSDNSFRGYLFLRTMPKKVDGVYYLGDNPLGNAPEGQKEYTYLVTYDDQLPFTTLTRRDYLLVIKERLEKAIRENGNSSGFYNQYVERVNENLRGDATELSRPAIVNRMDEERFTGFLREGDRGAYYAVRHNSAYYRKGLPKSAAQFFTVVYSVYEREPVYTANIDAVRKSLDLAGMRSLLGK